MSEEVKEKKKKTTKTAKFFGLLAGLGYLSILGGLIVATLAFFANIFGLDDHVAIAILVFLLVICVVPSVSYGVKINRRWELFSKRIRVIIGIVSLALISPWAVGALMNLNDIIPDFEFDKYSYSDDEKIRVYTTNDKNFRGRFIDWNDDFLVFEVLRKEMQIPKDKIHYIQRGW